jgi:hypothetical protein
MWKGRRIEGTIEDNDRIDKEESKKLLIFGIIVLIFLGLVITLI